MTQKLNSLVTLLLVVSLATTPALAADRTTNPMPAFSMPSIGVPNPPSDVVEYGVSSPEPSVFVKLGSKTDFATLESWANASSDRSVVDEYPSTSTALVAVPPSDIVASLATPSAWLRHNSLTDLNYVESWSWNIRVSDLKPIRSLNLSDTFSPPHAAWYAEAFTKGTYTASAMAWSGDAPNVNMTDTRSLVGADAVSANGSGVNIAVIDTGVNFGNGTLYGNGTAGSQMRVVDAHDFVDDQNVNLSVSRGHLSRELAKVKDPNGHGSWVSSAVANAKSGIAPDANLMVYRTLNAQGSGSTSDIRQAIERANANGADIITMSLGSPLYSPGLAHELEHVLGPNGNVTGVFIAAGNSYITTRYVTSPADVKDVIAVSATNGVNVSSAKKAYFSNIGPDTGITDASGGKTSGREPDTAAPGMNATTKVFTAYGVQTTETLSGTSMATPVAAGVGALLLSADPSLKGHPESFKSRLVNSGSHTPKIGDTESRGGLINATRAINGYSGSDAPDRILPDTTKGRDAANKVLAGHIGVHLASAAKKAGGLL